MQSLQSQQAVLSQTERISQIKSTVEEAFSDSKEEKENRATKVSSGEKPAVPFQMHEEAREKALAALLLRARDEGRENKGEEFEPKNAEKDEGKEEEEEDSAKDDSMEASDIPQMTIKPVEVLPSPPAVSKPMELNPIPSAANEISAQ